MANVSYERGIIDGLLSRSAQDPGMPDRPRFDPTVVTRLESPKSAEDVRRIFLKRTLSLPILGGINRGRRPARPIGHQTVALFAEQGPGISRETTEDIIHRGCDQAVWLRKPTDAELTEAGEINPRHAWIFEVVVPHLDRGDTVVPSGLQSDPFVP